MSNYIFYIWFYIYCHSAIQTTFARSKYIFLIMITKLYVLLSHSKGWDNNYAGERMSTPLVSYILFGVILFIVFMRILSWLQFIYLKRKAKKRIWVNWNKVDRPVELPTLYILESKLGYNANKKKQLAFWVYDVELNTFTSLYNNALPAGKISFETCLIFIHPDDREIYKKDLHLLSSGLIESMTEFLRFHHNGVYVTYRFSAIALKSVLTGKVDKIIGTEENMSK